jgi:hypothetical protein
LKAISSKDWGKQKETILATYNAITRSQIEYGCSIWGPAISDTNMSKLQKIQNTPYASLPDATKAPTLNTSMTKQRLFPSTNTSNYTPHSTDNELNTLPTRLTN